LLELARLSVQFNGSHGIVITLTVSLIVSLVCVGDTSARPKKPLSEDNLTGVDSGLTPEELTSLTSQEAATRATDPTSVDPTAADAAADAQVQAALKPRKKTAAVSAANRAVLVAMKEVVKDARSQVGYRETGNNCTKYGPCEEWCGHFVYWIWSKNGVRANRDSFKFRPSIWNWANSHHNWKSRNPRRGDIVAFRSHVGIVTAVKSGKIRMVSGNMGEKVRQSAWFTPSQGVDGLGPVNFYIAIADNVN